MDKESSENIRMVCMQSYMTESESSHIIALAEQGGLTVSEFIRRVALGHKMNSQLDKEVFIELLKINADIGRLGVLLKLALTANMEAMASQWKVRQLLDEIEDRQEELKELISLSERVMLSRSSDRRAR